MHDRIAFLSPYEIRHCSLVGRSAHRHAGVLGRSAPRHAGVLGCFSQTGSCCVPGHGRRFAGDLHRLLSEVRRTGCTRF